MGYDSVRIASEIATVTENYAKLAQNSKAKEATEYITAARKKYPNDYKIMNLYMWDIIGGCADNQPEVLISRGDELLQLCNCILEGCTVEGIRLEAITIKAKILHAKGDTPAALELLKNFPSWYQSANQKTEQLYAKDTPEFRYWVCRNMYELADVTANKLIKTIWYDNTIDNAERVLKCEAIADIFTDLTKQHNETIFFIMEKAAFAELEGKVMLCGNELKDTVRMRMRICQKNLRAAAKLTEKAKHDVVLTEYLVQTFGSSNLLEWTINGLRITEHAAVARLRKQPEFMDVLNGDYTL